MKCNGSWLKARKKKSENIIIADLFLENMSRFLFYSIIKIEKSRLKLAGTYNKFFFFLIFFSWKSKEPAAGGDLYFYIEKFRI